jgi:hypothetical protein
MRADPNTEYYQNKIGLNSFNFFTQVLKLVYDIKDYLEPDFYCELVSQIRDIAVEYSRNLIDEIALRKVTKKEIANFVQNVECLLNNMAYL